MASEAHAAPGTGLPASPWVLIDDTTIEQVAVLLESLTGWLLTAAPEHATSLAEAISAGDTDAEGIASWTDALAARLRHCTEVSEL